MIEHENSFDSDRDDTDETNMSSNTVVLGIFNDRSDFEHAVAALDVEGFRSADVSALFPSGDSNKEFAHEKASNLPEGTAVGATTGVVLGGALGWLAGVGAIAIPGLGAFIAAGPILAALAGVGMGGAVGGLTGALIGLGIPEYEAKRYEGQVQRGGILISVHCDNEEWETKAKRILAMNGAKDISSTSETEADANQSDRPYPYDARR